MSRTNPLAIVACTLVALPIGARAQAAPTVGDAPRGHVRALLERTWFQVDVLTLDLCFDGRTAHRFEAAFPDSDERYDDDVRDEAIRIGMGAERVVAVIEFSRDVSMDQFLSGIREDHERAVTAGLLADSTRRALGPDLRRWYGFLEERGVRGGDRIVHDVGPERVRSRYTDRQGRVLLERTAQGRERRNSVIGAVLAPGSSLGDDLVGALVRGGPRPDEGLPEACRPGEVS